MIVKMGVIVFMWTTSVAGWGTVIEGERVEAVDLLLLGEKRGDIQSESIVNINKEDGWSGAS